jgi:hypothetical protein
MPHVGAGYAMLGERDDLQPPERGTVDHVQAGVRAAMSAVPLGGAVAEVYHHVIGTPLQRRQDRWMASVAAALGKLFERVEGLSPEKLAEHEAFVSAAMRASQIAIRTHQQEKLDALRNAVLNVAAGTDVDDDQQSVFIDWIDALTPSHLVLLSFLRDPAAFAAARGKTLRELYAGSPMSHLEDAAPELASRREFVQQAMRDLHSRGLAARDSLGGVMTGRGTTQKATTALGDRFLDFITVPNDSR